jgi:DNA-directed RNA polymerase
MLVLHFGNGESYLDHLPVVRDGTQEGDRRPTACLEMVGMGAEQLDKATQVEATLM